MFSWELLGFWRTFFSSLAWCDSVSNRQCTQPLWIHDRKESRPKMRRIARQISRDVLPPFCLCATETFAEDVLWQTIWGQGPELHHFLMLLFKNLQERTIISCPSNLVYCFAILILGNIFLVTNSDVPCCGLILIQLAGTQRTHYSATANLTTITPALKKGA